MTNERDTGGAAIILAGLTLAKRTALEIEGIDPDTQDEMCYHIKCAIIAALRLRFELNPSLLDDLPEETT